MAPKALPQSVAACPQQSARTFDSPYLTAHEAVVYLRLGSLNALYRHIAENGLPYGRIGRQYRFDKRELDAWMKGFGSSVERARSLRAVR